jgi:hypothetical protein
MPLLVVPFCDNIIEPGKNSDPSQGMLRTRHHSCGVSHVSGQALHRSTDLSKGRLARFR